MNDNIPDVSAPVLPYVLGVTYFIVIGLVIAYVGAGMPFL